MTKILNNETRIFQLICRTVKTIWKEEIQIKFYKPMAILTQLL